MNAKFYHVLCCLALAAALPGCEDAQTKKSDIANVKKTIDSANREFSAMFAKGDSAGIAGLYTSDAKFMDAGAPAVA